MQFTIGLEEEYQLIDLESRKLVSHEQKIVELAGDKLSDQVKAAMHRAVVELGTNVCRTLMMPGRPSKPFRKF